MSAKASLRRFAAQLRRSATGTQSRARTIKFAAISALVLTVGIAGASAGVYALNWTEKLDDSTIPVVDEQLPRTADIKDYRIRYVLGLYTTNEGGGTGMETVTVEKAHDFEAQKISATIRDPKAELWVTVKSALCQQPTGDGNQNYAFPISLTMYKPGGKQTPTITVDYCVSDNEKGAITVEAASGQTGFGEYKVRGTYVDGEVGWTIAGKRWKYHQHDYDVQWDFKQEGRLF